MNHPQPVMGELRPRILVAPLNWGLGHATRCIPVIYELQRQGAEVWLAGDEPQGILLKSEFPGLPFLQLAGYEIKYGKTSFGLLKNLLLQTPRILRAIRQEHHWLQKAADEHGFDAVISDNRFGLYHPRIPGIFITHQLAIKSPLGKWNERLLQRINYRYINRFTECWVPDKKNEHELGGDLSHPVVLPGIPVHYIGFLSRLIPNNLAEKKGHLFISLSGPEPQRTLLENLIIHDIAHYNGTATIVRGLPGNERLIPSTNSIRFYNHLTAEEFNKEMQSAEFVVCRSGYSSVMDIITLGKKSILVPTPGQTEQLYLAKYLLEKRAAFSLEQKEFSLAGAVEQARAFEYSIQNNTNGRALEEAVQRFVNQLKKPRQV